MGGGRPPVWTMTLN